MPRPFLRHAAADVRQAQGTAGSTAAMDVIASVQADGRGVPQWTSAPRLLGCHEEKEIDMT